MWNWENKVWNGVYYSRIIASWRRVGGPYYDETFREWLSSLGLSDDEVWEVYDMATNGKMELEGHARKFLESKGIEPVKVRKRYAVLHD